MIVNLIMMIMVTMNSSEEQVPGGFSGMQQNPALMQAHFPFILSFTCLIMIFILEVVLILILMQAH